MDFSLSAINVLPLSSAISELAVDYVNSGRESIFTEISSLTAFNDYKLFYDVEDFIVDENSLSILTKNIGLSSLINMTDVLRVSYFKDVTDVASNLSVDVLSALPQNNQFLITAPLLSSLSFTIIPVKNSMLPSEEYSSQSFHRYYDGIYKIDNDIFLQYKTEHVTRYVDPDVPKNIYLPDNISSRHLSSLSFIENGLLEGSCPANSDNILIDRFGYSEYTDSGYTGIDGNSEMLCIWASGGRLFERWYDPLTVTQTDAYITQKASSSLKSIVDIPTSCIVGERSKIIVDRLGPIRNENFVDSLSSNLSIHFDSWGESFTDTINNVGGFIVGDYTDKNITYCELDGSVHGHVPPSDELHITQNSTIGLWVHSLDWSAGVDTQFWGNFSNGEGYGLFFNTGATNELITLPSNNGTIYGFNFKGYKIFEKTIGALSASDFQYVVTDYFGNRWIWDKNANQIIKLSSDDIVLEKISLPNSAKIESMKIDSQNVLYAHNILTNTLSSFDRGGNLISTNVIPSPYNNFDFTSNGSLIYAYGKNMIVDSNNNIYTTIGKNIYKNGNVWYHIYDKIQSIKLDSDDNILIFLGTKSLLKLNSSGDVLWNITIDYDQNADELVEMNFVKENYNNVESDILWIILNNNKILIKIDSSGRILRRINLKDVVNLRKCGDFTLKVRGDFSGFEVKRKFENATTENPAFSLKVHLTCGANKLLLQQYTPAKEYQKGWVHLSFTHRIFDNKTYITFFINGKPQRETVLDGHYQIDYGTKVSPFIIGGNSGKLGAKNVERSLNNSGYFKGFIDDIRIYKKVLDTSSIRSLSRNKYWNRWNPLLVVVPTPPRTYMEKIERFHLNKYPGFKSNKFNLRISGIPDTISQESIVNFINSKISSIKPAHTILNSIIFESLPTPLSPNPILSTWLLRDGIWDDFGLWNDDETWNDG